MRTALRRAMALTGPILLAACCGGCPKPCPQTLVPLEQLVREYNANAAAVPRLWARAKIALTLTSSKGRTVSWGSTLLAPNGRLLLAKPEDPNKLGPADFALIGYEVSQPLFRLGNCAADGIYYLWYRFGDQGGMWWGRTALAGAPGIEDLPIDPLQLLAVLCICELPSDFTQPPTVALSMNTEPGQCAYVLTYIDRQPVTGRLVFRREMYFRWDDNEPRRPFKVSFFDASGRRVMTADLLNYQPIDHADVEPAPARPSVMPTEINITWFDPRKKASGRIALVLSEMTTKRKWQLSACEPPDPEGMSPGSVIQVDRDVPTGGGPK